MGKLPSQVLLLGLTVFMGGSVYFTAGSATQALVVPVAAALLIGGGFLVERMLPFSRAWNQARHDTMGDVSALFVNDVLLDGMLKGILPVAVMWALAVFGPSMSPAIHWPLWLQIVVVSLLIELMAYLSHRLHHRLRSLWALHAMHHSPQRLYMFNNFRFHPLNYGINSLAMFVPAMLLGFSPDALLAYAALSLPVLVFQHANIDFQFGWINYVLNTNTVHRWHHSASPEHDSCNFGRATLIWDHLFGSFYLPQLSASPEEIGLQTGSPSRYPLPERLLAQLRYPFTAACC